MKLQQWAQWTEITASLSMVLALVFLIQEVRQNTRELRFQTGQLQGEMLSAPFFEAPELASVIAKIKAVDGPEPMTQALVERYGLSYEEAELWTRHLYLLWKNLEADFEANGASEDLDRWIRMLLESADEQLYWENVAPMHGPAFRAWVDGLRASS